MHINFDNCLLYCIKWQRTRSADYSMEDDDVAVQRNLIRSCLEVSVCVWRWTLYNSHTLSFTYN